MRRQLPITGTSASAREGSRRSAWSDQATSCRAERRSRESRNRRKFARRLRRRCPRGRSVTNFVSRSEQTGRFLRRKVVRDAEGCAAPRVHRDHQKQERGARRDRSFMRSLRGGVPRVAYEVPDPESDCWRRNSPTVDSPFTFRRLRAENQRSTRAWSRRTRLGKAWTFARTQPRYARELRCAVAPEFAFARRA